MCQALLAEVVDSSDALFVRALHVRVPSKEGGSASCSSVKMESCVKLFVDTAVMSTALKALQSSRIGRHTRERPYVRQPTPHRGCSPQPHRGESHAAVRFTGMYNYMTVLTPMYMFDRGPGGGEKGNLRPPCAPFTRLHGSRNTPRRDARGSQNAPAPAHTHPRLTVCPHYRTFYGGCRCTWGPRAARPRPWTPPTARHALSTTLALPHAGFARAACRRCSSRASQAEGVRNQAE